MSVKEYLFCVGLIFVILGVCMWYSRQAEWRDWQEDVAASNLRDRGMES